MIEKLALIICQTKPINKVFIILMKINKKLNNFQNARTKVMLFFSGSTQKVQKEAVGSAQKILSKSVTSIHFTAPRTQTYTLSIDLNYLNF